MMNFGFRSMIATLAITLGAAAVAPSQAHAYLLIAGAEGYTPDQGPWNNPLEGTAAVVLCVIALPFCLLDQHQSSAASISSTDLLANGYSAEQVLQIQKDQTQLSKLMQAQHMSLKVLPQDSKSSIQQQIASVYPQVSKTYLNFTTDFMGLK